MKLETRAIRAAHYIINGTLCAPRAMTNPQMFPYMREGELAYVYTSERQEVPLRIDEIIYIENASSSNWDIIIRGHTDHSKQKIRALVKP